MKNFSAIRSYGLLGILLLLGTGAAQGQSFGADKLKCEQETDPIGIETQTPRFSWQLYAPTRGAVQTAYQIIVSDTPEAVERGTGNVWDSKKIASSQSLLVPYAGEPLEAAKKYYWSVRVWDGTKKASPWARTASFAMGLLSQADWSGARWIAFEPDIDSLTVTDGLGRHLPVIGRYKLPQMRREFPVNKPVRRATAYVCGLGQFELFLNGTKTGDHFLDPAWTKFYK